jgi:C4-dicarboxylate transporter DctM subunit
MNPVVVLFLAFGATLLIGVPFIWSMVVSCLCATLVMDRGVASFSVFAQKMFTGQEKYVYLAIFFFMLAGAIMQHGGISGRLIRFAKAWFGHINGGLSIVVMIACMFFAALSGSSVATVVAIGSMLYPELVAAGYPKGYAAALPSAGGTLGIVIPPSIAFVVYGSTVNTSISKLLISGIVPGVLGGVTMCLYAYAYAKCKRLPKSSAFDPAGALKATKSAFWALLTPVIILGGIYSGVFTPTESAAVAVLYGIVVSIGYRSLTFRQFWRIIIASAEGTANILMLVGAASLLSWVMVMNGFPGAFTGFISQFVTSRITFLVYLNIMLAILGMIMDTAPVILIVAPLIAPMASHFGIDPVHLGCIVVFNLSVGQITPPFGLCLFAGAGITGQSVITIFKNTAPFILVLYGAVLLTSFVPELPLLLVKYMF